MIKNEMEIARAIDIYRSEVEAHGLDVVQLYDFDLLASVCQQHEKEEDEPFSLTEPFSTKYFDFTPETAFWIAVREPSGRIVSVQGARMDLLGPKNLADHWRQQQRRIYVTPYPEQKPEMGDQHCPDAYAISGNCVYHGNMWLTKDWLGKRLGQPLCRIGQLTAHLKWDLDYIYCFIEQRLVAKGFAAHQGYAHASPVGTDWIRAPSHIHPDDYLCWNRPIDLDHLARTTILSAQAEQSDTQ